MRKSEIIKEYIQRNGLYYNETLNREFKEALKEEHDEDVRSIILSGRPMSKPKGMIYILFASDDFYPQLDNVRGVYSTKEEAWEAAERMNLKEDFDQVRVSLFKWGDYGKT